MARAVILIITIIVRIHCSYNYIFSRANNIRNYNKYIYDNFRNRLIRIHKTVVIELLVQCKNENTILG